MATKSKHHLYPDWTTYPLRRFQNIARNSILLREWKKLFNEVTARNFRALGDYIFLWRVPKHDINGASRMHYSLSIFSAWTSQVGDGTYAFIAAI
ncbi:hypothetical protein Lal_00031978, partial [Lupinus albus]